jgi:dihydrofolate reductase
VVYEGDIDMRDLIVTEFVSLDGVMEAPGGEPGYAHAGWVNDHFTDELGRYKFEEQNAADLLLMGRTTYESFYGAWPERNDPMADKINSMRKIVVSTTLRSSEWTDTTVVDSLAPIAAAKAEDGGPILVAGSRKLAHSLLTAGLVDQINLQVFPVILGSGFRVYPDSPDRTNLSLKSSQTLDNGVILQSWRVVRS